MDFADRKRRVLKEYEKARRTQSELKTRPTDDPERMSHNRRMGTVGVLAGALLLAAVVGLFVTTGDLYYGLGLFGVVFLGVGGFALLTGRMPKS